MPKIDKLPNTDSILINKAISHVQKSYCNAHLHTPYLLIGDVAELIKILTGEEIGIELLYQNDKLMQNNIVDLVLVEFNRMYCGEPFVLFDFEINDGANVLIKGDINNCILECNITDTTEDGVEVDYKKKYPKMMAILNDRLSEMAKHFSSVIRENEDFINNINLY